MLLLLQYTEKLLLQYTEKQHTECSQYRELRRSTKVTGNMGMLLGFHHMEGIHRHQAARI